MEVILKGAEIGPLEKEFMLKVFLLKPPQMQLTLKTERLLHQHIVLVQAA
jgi:hypothetical protein